MRRFVRGILAGGIVAAALLAAAGPAAAKCGHDGVRCLDVKLRVTIDGPSLAAPLVIRGKDAWSMLNVTSYYYLPYNHVADMPPAELGPRFEAIYRFTRGDRSWLVYQGVYPYAAGRPFAFTPAGQRFVDRYSEVVEVIEAAHGWRGSRTLQTILQAHGLPAGSPASTTASAAGAVAPAGNDDAGGPPSWVWLAVGTGLVGLGGLGVRRRFRRRSAGAPA